MLTTGTAYALTVGNSKTPLKFYVYTIYADENKNIKIKEIPKQEVFYHHTAVIPEFIEVQMSPDIKERARNYLDKIGGK